MLSALDGAAAEPARWPGGAGGRDGRDRMAHHETHELRPRAWLASACTATLLLAALPTAQQPAPAPRAASTGAAATRAGFSVERLRRVDALLQRYVDEKRLAGAVALVLRDGQPVYERAVGWSDKEAGRPMAMDTIFRIASQTKAMTSVAVLSLMEEGRLDLADPVSRFVPAFATTTVSVAGPNGPSIVPAKRADHHPGSADAHRRHFLRHRAACGRGLRGQGAGAGGGPGLVLRRQGRRGVPQHRPARHRAVPRAARRGVGVRLQHRHPRLRRRAHHRPVARRGRQGAHHRPARPHRHAVLPAAGAAHAAGGALRERPRRHDRARPRRGERAGPLRRGPAPQLLGRRRSPLHRARLRALPRDDPSWAARSTASACWRRAPCSS